MRSVGIQPVLFQNDAWISKLDKKPITEVLRNAWGEFPTFVTSTNGMPSKPRAEAMAALLAQIGCATNEVLYIGNSEQDMQTAVNGKVLFLNGVWLRDAVEYGFKFANPKEVARFIDIFCVRKHDWSFNIDCGNLKYYALAPFSTMNAQYAEYSASARAMAKDGVGNPEFWGRYLCATLFLSGLHSEINYVCPFPSHEKGKWNDPLKAALESFAKCFRSRYLPDLLVRHTTQLRSHKNRASMSHTSHLETVCLNRLPIKNTSTGEQYKNPPLRSGKTVLVVDDICTNGYSLEVARFLIERTGAKAVLLSWLKTINTPFVELGRPVSAVTPTIEHPYVTTFSDADAYKELSKHHGAYDKWNWPSGC